jgi:GntR family histidine utilization transcriptional repressor
MKGAIEPQRASTPAATLDRRIRRDIERAILSGRWPPGFRVPAEHELMATYRCSRMTVSKALGALASAGLLIRRRRAGTFVEQPHVQLAALSIPDIEAEIRARGDTYALRLLARRVRWPRPRSPLELKLAGKGRLLALTCLHLATGRPTALEQRLVSLSAVPEAVDANFAAESPGAWLLARVPWTHAEHRVRSINVDSLSARRLAIGISTACLELERHTWRGRQGVTHVRQIFPGGLLDLVARFTPGDHVAATWGGLR